MKRGAVGLIESPPFFSHCQSTSVFNMREIQDAFVPRVKKCLESPCFFVRNTIQ
jgi:hypothetical protein